MLDGLKARIKQALLKKSLDTAYIVAGSLHQRQSWEHHTPSRINVPAHLMRISFKQPPTTSLVVVGGGGCAERCALDRLCRKSKGRISSLTFSNSRKFAVMRVWIHTCEPADLFIGFLRVEWHHLTPGSIHHMIASCHICLADSHPCNVHN